MKTKISTTNPQPLITEGGMRDGSYYYKVTAEHAWGEICANFSPATDKKLPGEFDRAKQAAMRRCDDLKKAIAEIEEKSFRHHYYR